VKHSEQRECAESDDRRSNAFQPRQVWSIEKEESKDAERKELQDERSTSRNGAIGERSDDDVDEKKQKRRTREGRFGAYLFEERGMPLRGALACVDLTIVLQVA